MNASPRVLPCRESTIHSTYVLMNLGAYNNKHSRVFFINPAFENYPFALPTGAENDKTWCKNCYLGVVH